MGEGCGPFREKQACRFSVNILFVLFVCLLLVTCIVICVASYRDTICKM